jgi:hypothetical protein
MDGFDEICKKIYGIQVFETVQALTTCEIIVTVAAYSLAMIIRSVKDRR